MVENTLNQQNIDSSIAYNNLSDIPVSAKQARTGNLNSYKTGNRISKELHAEQDLIDKGIVATTQHAGDLVKQSVNATNNIVISFFDKVKELFNGVNSKTSSGGKTAHKLITGVLSGGFLIAGLKSTLDFFKNLFNRDSKKNSFLKFIDATIKWVMGLTLFRTFANKKGLKFDNLQQVLLGAGASLFVGQLSGVNEGKRNLLRSLSKATGIEKTLERVSGYSPLPGGENLVNAAIPDQKL